MTLIVRALALLEGFAALPVGAYPTAECLQRLHAVVDRVYWTESGAGVAPALEAGGCALAVLCAGVAIVAMIGVGAELRPTM